MPSILLIEDQPDIAANIWDYFERRGFLMDHAHDGATGLRLAMGRAHDLIVLDLGLPRLDGLDVCRELRVAGSHVPILMLTARDTVHDKVLGFSLGADDYLVKPFAMAELEARIRVLLRRRSGLRSGELVFGELAFAPGTLTVRRAGQAISLTRTQVVILAKLLERAPNLVTHEELIRAVWGERGGDLPALHTHMHALRAAIDKPFALGYITSVRGMGYRLSDDGQT
jgi:DNA-binding response OmpR family regulator